MQRTNTVQSLQETSSGPDLNGLSLPFGPRDATLQSQVRELQRQVANLRNTLANRDAQLKTLRRQALQDPVTGLPNRRAFHKALDQAVADYRRYNRPGAVLMIDLNDFKVINDERGHVVGDRVLAHVAELLTANLRESDIVARTGGDEYCVLLREVTPTQVSTAAQRLSQTIARQPYCDAGRVVAISVSAGGCSLSEASTRNALLQLADQRMYRHKSRYRSGGQLSVSQTGSDNGRRPTGCRQTAPLRELPQAAWMHRGIVAR